MAEKFRKMLGKRNIAGTQSLLELIESKNKIALCRWCLDYAQSHFLPSFERLHPFDPRMREILEAGRSYLAKEIPYSEVKNIIWYEGDYMSAQEPVALAYERAIGQAASLVRYPSKWHALGVYYYGAAAVAYDRAGLEAAEEVYDKIAEEVCLDMIDSLKAAPDF